MLNLNDLYTILDLTNKAYSDIPLRTRFPGMDRDFTNPEKVALAYYNALRAFLNLKDGVLPEIKFESL